MTPRLTRLVDIAPEKVARERAVVMRRGNEFGQKEAVRALFYKLKEDSVAHAPHYFAMMWAFDSYDEQVGFLMDELVPAGGGKGWEMNPEVFNAQLWQLMLEDRYEDMHQLVEVIKKKHIRLDDRSFYVLKRAGQRMRKQRRAQIDERCVTRHSEHPWHTPCPGPHAPPCPHAHRSAVRMLRQPRTCVHARAHASR